MAEETFEIDDLEEELNEIGSQSPAKKTSSNRNIWIVGIVITGLAVGAILFSLDFFKSENTLNTQSNTKKINVDTKKVNNKKIKYETLYSQLPASQVSDVIQELSFSNIVFKLEQKGKNYGLLIDRDQIEEAKVLLATKGLPSGKMKGYELLDESQTLGVTEFDKKVRFLRALSGELEKVITKLEMIEEARVQIVIPKERLFVTKQPNVTASILIRVNNDYVVSDITVLSIMQLVARAVENLEVKNISVVDTQGRNLTFGLLERIEKNKLKNGQDEVNNLKNKKVTENIDQDIEEIKKLQPIVPNFKSIKQWFIIKDNYEKNITQKIREQLSKMFPVETYKVGVNTEITAINEGNSAKIQRTSVSIILDENSEDTYLDEDKKVKVFSTIAAIIGYQKNRDIIELTEAPFFKDKVVWDYLKEYQILIVFACVIALVFIGFLIFIFSRKKSQNKQNKPQKNKYDKLKEEIETEKMIDQIKQEAEADPQLVASVIEQILNEKNNET